MMEILRVRILNLTCAGCVPKIEQVMRQQEGVIWAIVNFAAGEATIHYDPAAFSIIRFTRAVDRSGYRTLLGNEPDRISQLGLNKPNPLAQLQQWVRALQRSF